MDTAPAPTPAGQPAVWAERHHWLNALVGMLDSAFRLTDTEQFFVLDVVSRLLDALDIPYRDDPQQLPAPVAHEVESGIFAKQLSGVRDAQLDRPVRPVMGHDIVVSVEAWRTALLKMIVTAYPDLAPAERMVAANVLDDLLAAIGVPDRLATFFPAEVVTAYYEVDLVP